MVTESSGCPEVQFLFDQIWGYPLFKKGLGARGVRLLHHFMSHAMPPLCSCLPLCGPSATLVALPLTFVALLTALSPRALVRTSPGELLFLSSGSGDRRALSRAAWGAEYWYQCTQEARHVEQPAQTHLALETFPSSNTELLNYFVRTLRVGS
jgi:hypothetical protein